MAQMPPPKKEASMSPGKQCRAGFTSFTTLGASEATTRLQQLDRLLAQMLPPETEASTSPGKQYRAGRPRPEGRAALPVPPPRETKPEVRGTALMLLRPAHTKEFEEFQQTFGTTRVADSGPLQISGARKGTELLLRIHIKEFEAVGTTRDSDFGRLLLPSATCDDEWKVVSKESKLRTWWCQ
ncbi:hypothetical protein AAVH_12157 [Aphelenchoides avenae]|nr:hypothetical protein AAVH_12157 [Aphelenchus avenae]